MKYVIPSDEDSPLDSAWFAPLDAVARTLAGNHHYRFFDPDDFMIMVRLLRPPRPSLTPGQAERAACSERAAHAATSALDAMPSLARMLETCTDAVLVEMKSLCAICPLVSPSAISAATSCSRAVRDPSPAAGRWAEGWQRRASAAA